MLPWLWYPHIIYYLLLIPLSFPLRLGSSDFGIGTIFRSILSIFNSILCEIELLVVLKLLGVRKYTKIFFFLLISLLLRWNFRGSIFAEHPIYTISKISNAFISKRLRNKLKFSWHHMSYSDVIINFKIAAKKKKKKSWRRMQRIRKYSYCT